MEGEVIFFISLLSDGKYWKVLYIDIIVYIYK